MKGYPPSALSLILRLVERAGVDSRSGGSITALYTVLADGDDTDDPIVDAARAIVDGHIVLSRQLSEQSIFPARSVERRVGHECVSTCRSRWLRDHSQTNNQCIVLYNT